MQKGYNSGTRCKMFYIALKWENCLRDKDTIRKNAEITVYLCYRYGGEIE